MLNKGWAWLAVVAAGGAAALTVPVAALADPGTGARATLAAAGDPASLTLEAPATVARLGSLTLTGTLSAGAGPLSVTRRDLAGSHPLAAVTADAAGAFTVHDKPPVGGANTYTVSWAGDDTYGPVSRQVTVTVSRRAATLSVTRNASTYAYHAAATVTAKLGTTHDVRTVCLYATPRGGTKVKIKCGSGTVTAAYRITRRTTFSAAFAGDQWYLPRTVSTSATARAQISQVLDRQYGTSGKDKLYHRSVDPLLLTRILPARPGGCYGFQAQAYVSKAWRTVLTKTCFTLNGDSIGGVELIGSHTSGMRWRLRSTFAGDATNAAATGSWQYLKFTA
ncbi:hypothetical protein ACPCHT_37710 [Nucisporomicrobium flavum]|uniref:hypothetical protein n=1 Tax=Nucisporomicrobium flavum TaxID=2785915 RepID=UPI003C307B92